MSIYATCCAFMPNIAKFDTFHFRHMPQCPLKPFKFQFLALAHKPRSSVSMTCAVDYTAWTVLPCLGGVVAPEDKQTVLNVYDSHSGCVFAISVPLRKNVPFMWRELMKILQFLRYSTVVSRCDAEPALMKVQGLLQNSWAKTAFENIAREWPGS